jgi:hypothetical protein
MAKQLIKLTESDLRKIIKESVKQILSESRKPSDKTVGKHTLKGLRYDKSGNPLYTSDTMSDDEKKSQGWKFSKKHGLYGQLSDPTKLHESDLRKIVKESVQKILTEMDWRSYQAAYEAEIAKNGWTKRAEKFRQAAVNAFNRQNGYGLKNVPYGYQKDDKMSIDGDFYSGANLYTIGGGDTFATGSGSGHLQNNGNNEPDKMYSQQYISKYNGQQLPNEMENNGKTMNLMLKAKQAKGDKQVRDYFNGKTQYQQGKGWVNK